MKKFSVIPAVITFSLASSGFAASNIVKVNGYEAIKGEILIKLKDGNSFSKFNLKNFQGLSIKEEVETLSGNFILAKTNQKSIKALMQQIESSDEVEYAEPNFVYRAIRNSDDVNDLISRASIKNVNYTNNISANFTDPTDPSFGQLWGLVNLGNNEPAKNGVNSSQTGVAGADINASAAWGITKGSRNVKVAVIDTGIDYNHPDLVNQIWTNEAEANGQPGVDDDGNGYVDDIHGMRFIDGDTSNDPIDGHGHGTHCAGTIGAEHDNGIGVAGVMGNVEIVAIKFLTDRGSGTSMDAIRAVNYATTLDVDIMSNSWGGGPASQALEDTIRTASEAGIVFVAAAGNSASNNNTRPHYPSNYDVENVISVAAHNYSDRMAYFSCYGSQTVHVAAPGRNILSTVTNGEYSVYSGTSMATPHVTGVVGLLLSSEGRMPVTDVRERLMATTVEARAYRSKTISGGRVDAHNLLTDNRPVRNRPDPSAWIATDEHSFESAHPYADNAEQAMTIQVPGARYIRVVVESYNLEANYDFLDIKDGTGELIERISGEGTNYTSEYVDGDSITMEFTSDGSMVRWGFRVAEVQYIL